MRGVKVLQLDFWMTEEDLDEEFKHLKQVDPVFGRPGRYLKRMGRGKACCWFELPDGRAFETSAAQFRFELEGMEASELDQNKIAAIKHVVDQGMATKEQARLLYMWRHQQDIRRILQDGQRTRLRFQKEYPGG